LTEFIHCSEIRNSNFSIMSFILRIATIH
jgi:hypothetical protein